VYGALTHAEPLHESHFVAQCGGLIIARRGGTVPSRGVKLSGRWVMVVALPLMVMLLSSVALAQESELGGKVRTGDEVVVPAGETVPNDLYVFGGSVRIDGTVNGDLVAFGGQVEVSGPVTGDVLAGASTTTISGQVDGDVRVGTGRALIQGTVGEDVLVGASQVTIASGARIGGDLIFGSGQTSMDGTVAGNVVGSTDTYRKGGSIAGAEQVTEPTESRTAGHRILGLLRRYVSLLAVGALLLWLTPRALRATADIVRGRPLPSLGAGLLSIIGAAALVLAVIIATGLVAIVLGLLELGALAGTTVFAGILVIGLIVFGFFVIAAFGAQVAVGLSLGRLPLRANARSSAREFGVLALGVLVVVLLSAIPLVGGWLEFLFVLLGLGALALAARSRRRPL